MSAARVAHAKREIDGMLGELMDPAVMTPDERMAFAAWLRGELKTRICMMQTDQEGAR